MLKKKQKKIFGPSKKKISKINLVFGIILLLLGTILIFYVNYSNIHMPTNLVYGIIGAGVYLIILGFQFLLGIE